MTATTAIPEAVLTGLAFNFGKRVFLCSGGTAAMMSTSLGESSKYDGHGHTPLSLEVNRPQWRTTKRRSLSIKRLFESFQMRYHMQYLLHHHCGLGLSLINSKEI